MTSTFESVLEWVQTTAVARSVAESLPMTAWLSAVHLIGFTLVMGAALLANLSMLGLVMPQRPAAQIAVPASRVIALGLAISIVTGALLFSARAAAAAANGTFQLKMLLLVSAALFHFTVQTRLIRRPRIDTHVMRLAAGLGLSLWIGLALAACAFILFE